MRTKHGDFSFLAGRAQLAPNVYMNASVLATSLYGGHKLLFALVLNSVYSTDTSNTNDVVGTVESNLNTIAVVRRILSGPGCSINNAYPFHLLELSKRATERFSVNWPRVGNDQK